MRHICANLLIIAICVSPARCAELAVSSLPPGGLAAADTPQFILWSFDDEVNQESTGLVLELSSALRNPNGCAIPVTWFACTSPNCGFSCEHAVLLHKLGHELAVHTRTHAGLRWYHEVGMIEDEVLGSRDDMLACGLPKEAVTGFRTPYLADKPEVRQVLAEGGFRYDSSIGVKGGADKLWPATMGAGVPYDCTFSGNTCDPKESYPGMWQVPLYSSPEPDVNLMDYCTVEEGDGSVQQGCSAYDVLTQAFDEAYESNRAPVTIGVHKPYMQKSEFRSDLLRLLGYALSHPHVWVVTHSQLLDWMEAPVPVGEMEAFMAQYGDCSA